ncbi:hypothetical protein G5B30_04910 [Sphingobacterium sp. SGG-5]|uniref:hypothetical protein n=1 Tax=Sphingobacterium sp. SGG-5 TaxID=2710881 RepID=UPI0013EBA9D9|nr:hypothetical protein [Sphingobacterium sp. SGG-5]NGM61255.1 hypothetical protein [Sphingobacterium sp. SGG-5]
MDALLLKEKLNLIQRLAETDDESILMQVKALLFAEKEAVSESAIPDWFMPELLERQQVYERGEAQTLSWEECKTALLQRMKK